MKRVLTGKVIAITGASSGIGAATALALAAERVTLVLAARRRDRLEAIAAEARQLGSTVQVMTCDVGQRAEVEALVRNCVQAYGRLDIMMANAGYGLVGRVQDVSDEQFDDCVRVNVKGTLYVLQAAAGVMVKQGAGHILVTSSAVARRSLPLYGVYSMTKAAQLSLAEALRVELMGTGVQISTVHPATTKTDFFKVATARSGVTSSGHGGAQTAAQVAVKIVRLMKRPKPELWPKPLSRLGLSFATMFPRMTDLAIARMLNRWTEV